MKGQSSYHTEPTFGLANSPGLCCPLLRGAPVVWASLPGPCQLRPWGHKHATPLLSAGVTAALSPEELSNQEGILWPQGPRFTAAVPTERGTRSHTGPHLALKGDRDVALTCSSRSLGPDKQANRRAPIPAEGSALGGGRGEGSDKII